MRGGRLRHSIVIQETTESRGANGEVLNTWGTFAAVRAEVTPMQGREAFLAGQDLSERIVRFKIRHLSGITAKMRISYDSRIFDIESVIYAEERNREVHILTREVL